MMDIAKICIKCNVKKPISEYYGVQGDCKSCVKERVKKRREELSKNPDWVEKEKRRHREKYHRLGYKEKHKPSSEKRRETMKKYRERYPEKYKAKNATQKLPRENNSELHHWSYNDEHHTCVIELSTRDHNIAHRFMIYDQERMMYRRCDNGELLDTREKHEKFINARIQEELAKE